MNCALMARQATDVNFRSGAPSRRPDDAIAHQNAGGANDAARRQSRNAKRPPLRVAGAPSERDSVSERQRRLAVRFTALFAGALRAGALRAGAFLAVALRAGAFLAVAFFLAGALRAGAFLAVAFFLAGAFLAVALRAGAFLAVAFFFAGAFLAGAFFAAALRAGAFFAAAYFLAGAFLVATGSLLLVGCSLPSRDVEPSMESCSDSSRVDSCIPVEARAEA